MGDKEKSFQCDLCPKKFKYKGNLTYHGRSVHESYRPLKCQSCPAKFSHKNDMKKHFEAVHEKKRPYSCVLCEDEQKIADFSSMAQLNVHNKGNLFCLLG